MRGPRRNGRIYGKVFKAERGGKRTASAAARGWLSLQTPKCYNDWVHAAFVSFAPAHLTVSFRVKAACTSGRKAASTGCPRHRCTTARRYTAAAPETWGE